MNVEIRAARLEERPTICHLIDLAFDSESYGPSLARPCVSVGNSHLDPDDRPENTRVLLADGQIVSVVHVLERKAYACGGRVRFGFIAMVATHPDHRRRGYMRRAMRDAEDCMQRLGLCYAVLMGSYRLYGASLGWRLCSERRATLNWKYMVPANIAADAGVGARPATEEDIPFLARLYEARYGKRFGPVVRSGQYWRRWSLQRPEEGTYMVALADGEPAGYFHIGGAHDDVDEIGWEQARDRAAVRVLLAASSCAGTRGMPTVSFWIDEADEAGMAEFRRTFGEVPRTFVDPLGQPVEGCDPAPFLPENCPDATGLFVKFLGPGPGILRSVDSSDALTEAMARYSWVMFDEDIT